MKTRTAAIAIGVLLVLLALQAGATGQFRISYRMGPREPTSAVLVGTVFNDSPRDVVDVWVTAEALNASGTVVATGIAFVAGLLPGRDSVPFVAKVPAVEGVSMFRIEVTSFRYWALPQSP